MLTEAPTGRAMDASPVTGGESVGNAPPGSWSGNYGLHDEWLRRIDRLAFVAEREVALARSGALTHARSREGLKERILTVHRGRDAVEVAFIEGTSESFVRKTRDQAGQRTADGRPKKERQVRDECSGRS